MAIISKLTTEDIYDILGENYKNGIKKEDLTASFLNRIVFFSFAEEGAQGCPGEIIIYTQDGNRHTGHFLYGNFTYNDIKRFFPAIGQFEYPQKQATANFCNNLSFISHWEYIGLGYGNHLFVSKKYSNLFYNKIEKYTHIGELYNSWEKEAVELLMASNNQSIKQQFDFWLLERKNNSDRKIILSALEFIIKFNNLKGWEDLFEVSAINKYIIKYEEFVKNNNNKMEYKLLLNSLRELNYFLKKSNNFVVLKQEEKTTTNVLNNKQIGQTAPKSKIDIKNNCSLYNIFLQCKKTAGCWFIVKYLKDIEKNYDNLLDMDFKRNYAKKVFAESKRDCHIENTMIRINCMMRLVKYGLTDYAYDYAINSNWY